MGKYEKFAAEMLRRLSHADTAEIVRTTEDFCHRLGQHELSLPEHADRAYSLLLCVRAAAEQPAAVRVLADVLHDVPRHARGGFAEWDQPWFSSRCAEAEQALAVG